MKEVTAYDGEGEDELDDVVGIAGGIGSGGGSSCNSSQATSKKSLDRVKGPWSPEEDEMLGRLVSNLGAKNWSLIAQGIPGRSGKSCRLRWCNQLDPAVKRKPFTQDDEVDKTVLQMKRIALFFRPMPSMETNGHQLHGFCQGEQTMQLRITGILP